MISLFDIKRILTPEKSTMPSDDFRIIQSWAEYDETSGKNPENKNLNYLCYELEVMNPDTGERIHLFKAIKFARVIRLPANAKQSTAFMNMQQQILAGVYENNYDFITIIANMIRPTPIGLLYLYGVQGVSKDHAEAKKIADADFLGLIGMIQGTFRVIELKCIEAQETEWLREKMYNMDYLTVVRGIPKAGKAGEDAGNKGMGGSNVNPDSQGTLEEIIAGMADYEYVIEVLSTPVYLDTLVGWQRRSQEEMSTWYGQLQGQKSLSMNLSIPMMYMANVGQSQGWSKAHTDANTTSYSQGESFTSSQGQSYGESVSQSQGTSVGHTKGHSISNSVSHSISKSLSEGYTESQGVSHGYGTSHTVGQSHGVSTNQNHGMSVNQSQGTSQNASHGFNQGANVGASKGTSYGMNEGFNQGTNIGHTKGFSQGSSYNVSSGQSVGTSHNVGSSENFGYNESQSISRNNSAGISNSHSHSSGVSSNENYSSGHSNGFSQNSGFNQGKSDSEGSGGSTSAGGSALIVNGNYSHNWSQGSGHSAGSSEGAGYNEGSSYSHSAGSGRSSSIGESNSVSQSASLGYSNGFGRSHSLGVSESYGTNYSKSLSEGFGVSQSQSESTSIGNSYGYSYGQNYGQNYGTSVGKSIGESVSVGSGTSNSAGSGLSSSIGSGTNAGISASNGISENISQSQSVSKSQTIGQSVGQTLGQTTGQSVSDSVSQSQSQSFGQNTGRSESISNGNSYSSSNGTSKGTSAGTTGATSLGTSSSMGLGPSIGYSKSYQWMDQGVKDLLEIMEYQNERIKKALRGEGAFYTYVYISCPSLDALSTAQALAKSTWQNEYAMTNPLQVLDITETEQKHLLYHFMAFSADVTKEDVYGVREYKYCTVLLPEEFVAYTHLPRISEGGIFTIVQDIPKFSVPSMLKGEIYMGTILNPERFTFKNGYRTPYDYRIDESCLMHGYFTGASRSGKTVAAMRFIAELSKVRRSKTGKRLRIVAMDPKQDWRTLARFVEPERFNFYSLGNLTFRPIKINPWKIPHGVWPQLWIDGVIDIYCRAYGLLERGKQMIADVVFELYEEAGVFNACDKPDWKETTPELSKKVNFHSIYRRMEEKKAEMEGKRSGGNDTKDAYARLLERLSCFAREYSIECKLYGTSDGIGIDDLIGDDDVTVLESKGLENTFKNFIFGVITSGFYKYAVAHEGGFLADDQYETVLVIEEANEVLIGTDTSKGDNVSLSGESEFEQILDQSAGYGLFVFAITQKIADMPSSIIANAGIVFAGKLKRPEDISVVVRAVGREERIDDRDLVKWFPRSPIGYFVCQTSRSFDFKDAEPVLVQISRLNINPPSNLELDEIILQKEIKQHLKEIA